MKKVYQFARSLSITEWVYLSKAWLIIAKINVTTRWLNYSSWKLRLVEAMQQKQTAGPKAPKEEIYRLRKLFNAALRMQFLPTNCLRRSLALYIFLKRHRIETRLRVGTKLTNGLLHGHAWLEHDGIVLNDHETIPRQYIPFLGDNLQHIAFSG
jgi:hypothetical protein